MRENFTYLQRSSEVTREENKKEHWIYCFAKPAIKMDGCNCWWRQNILLIHQHFYSFFSSSFFGFKEHSRDETISNLFFFSCSARKFIFDYFQVSLSAHSILYQTVKLHTQVQAMLYNEPNKFPQTMHIRSIKYNTDTAIVVSLGPVK